LPANPIAAERLGEKEREIVELIPALRAFARTLCRNPADADDLVQETLTKAIANVDKFRAGTRMKSWLFTIMRNSFSTRVVRSTREAPGAADCVSGQATAAPPQEWSAQVREVREAIARLPRPQREVLVLIGMLGMSYEETAGICGCAVGTVKSRLSRARSGLVELLERPPAHDGPAAPAGGRRRASAAAREPAPARSR
jgi:RNA polymerase sigma-70 factor (ECF subfamily)